MTKEISETDENAYPIEQETNQQAIEDLKNREAAEYTNTSIYDHCNWCGTNKS